MVPRCYRHGFTATALGNIIRAHLSPDGQSEKSCGQGHKSPALKVQFALTVQLSSGEVTELIWISVFTFENDHYS